MIQLYISSEALVFPVQEVLCAPNPDCTVISARGQVLPVAAEIKARHIPTVVLKNIIRQKKKHMLKQFWKKKGN